MRILAVNPYIFDFAAYNFWIKPYGFAVILTYLKNKNPSLRLHYIDCLQAEDKISAYGNSRLKSEIIEKPAVFKNIPRHYRRYGISPAQLRRKLHSLKGKKFDFILLTSTMTYWYLAVKECAQIIKEYFPHTPLVLGGNYATLCFQHAQDNIGADYVFSSSQLENFFSLLNTPWDKTGFLSTLPFWELLYHLGRGCCHNYDNWSFLSCILYFSRIE